MSLIRCFECRKKVSIKADACPNCGCPMNKDFIKDFNEIENQIKEQQETIKEQQESIKDIKVQVKGQVEQLEKEKKNLKKKRAIKIKRKLKKLLRNQLKKEKKHHLFKCFFCKYKNCFKLLKKPHCHYCYYYEVEINKRKELFILLQKELDNLIKYRIQEIKKIKRDIYINKNLDKKDAFNKVIQYYEFRNEIEISPSEIFNIEYLDERDIHLKEQSIKIYNTKGYEKLICDYYLSMKKGEFVGIIVYKNEKDTIIKYEAKLPTNSEFRKVHGDIVIHYTVYKNIKVITLDNITPEVILKEGKENKYRTYKGIPISKSNAEKDKFRIDLLKSTLR